MVAWSESFSPERFSIIPFPNVWWWTISFIWKFDIDFVDPAYAPGTGTPEAGGFTGYDSISLVRGLTDIDFIGYDMVEVMPAYDPANVTCLLAANIIYEFISLIALQKRGNSNWNQYISEEW